MLYVTVNGETVAYGPSEETRIVRFCCTSAADTVSLKYEAGEDSEGCAEIFGFAGYRGLRLTIR
ncbi:MAG: hypothetical protein J6R18_06430 [Kiritimatiellae bacterium]|nr:hypothetical protein [Kiritimatiellia bacterium]